MRRFATACSSTCAVQPAIGSRATVAGTRSGSSSMPVAPLQGGRSGRHPIRRPAAWTDSAVRSASLGRTSRGISRKATPTECETRPGGRDADAVQLPVHSSWPRGRTSRVRSGRQCGSRDRGDARSLRRRSSGSRPSNETPEAGVARVVVNVVIVAPSRLVICLSCRTDWYF